MGCASSKSTPVVDSISSGANDLKDSSNGLLKKGKEAVKEMANEVGEMGTDFSHKIGSMADKLRSSQLNTPETERAQGSANDEDCEQEDGGAGDSPQVPVRILSIDLDEDNTAELRDNQVPVKVSLSIGDSDSEAGGEKPPTPMPEDDCFSSNDGDKDACTCDDESDSETCFDTMRTRHSCDDDEDACCAESVQLNFDDNAAVGDDDDCANQGTECSEDACATDRGNCASQEDNDDCCADAENDGTEVCECEEESDDNEECTCGESDDCADDSQCGADETENCADDECAGNASKDCDQTAGSMCAQDTNTGTLHCKCFCRGDDACRQGGSTMKGANCATATNTMRSTDSAASGSIYCDQCKTNTVCSQFSTQSAQCCCAGDTSTLQSECSRGSCASDTLRSCSSCVSEESCGADGLCAACARQAGSMNSNFSESTVRSNSFECLSLANDNGRTAGHSWDKTDTYRTDCAGSNQRASCLVCMGTGTIRSRSVYTNTMDSSYSQQYGNCATQSVCNTMRSQQSDSESDSDGDAKESASCFKLCSCLGQNLIQVQLR